MTKKEVGLMSVKKNNTCPIPCNIRIDKLQEALEYIIRDLHDLMVSVTDESVDFYEGMWDAFEEYIDKIKEA